VCYFLTLNNLEGLKKITLRNAKKLEWASIVLLGKAVIIMYILLQLYLYISVRCPFISEIYGHVTFSAWTVENVFICLGLSLCTCNFLFVSEQLLPGGHRIQSLEGMRSEDGSPLMGSRSEAPVAIWGTKSPEAELFLFKYNHIFDISDNLIVK